MRGKKKPMIRLHGWELILKTMISSVSGTDASALDVREDVSNAITMDNCIYR